MNKAPTLPLPTGLPRPTMAGTGFEPVLERRFRAVRLSFNLSLGSDFLV